MIFRPINKGIPLGVQIARPADFKVNFLESKEVDPNTGVHKMRTFLVEKPDLSVQVESAKARDENGNPYTALVKKMFF